MVGDPDEIDNFHSQLSKLYVLFAATLAVILAIIFDRLVKPGHVRLLAFSLLLTFLYLGIFRTVLTKNLIWLIIIAALAINLILAFTIKPEMAGMPSVVFIPIVLVEFSIVYIVIGRVIKPGR